MSKVRLFVTYWLPVLAWIGVTFTASADSHSYQHSSRILVPILHWLFPHLSKDALDWCLLIARKCAHLTEYAILGLLIWRALRQPVKGDTRPWSWRTFGWTIVLVALCASGDEFHQRFVPTRDPAVHDVVIDTVGATLGLLALRMVMRWRRLRQSNRGGQAVATAQPGA